MPEKNQSLPPETTVLADSLSLAKDGALQVMPQEMGRSDRINALIINDLQSPLGAMAGLLDLVLRDVDALRPDQAALVQRAYDITRSLSQSTQRLFHLYGARHAGLTPNAIFIPGQEVVNAAVTLASPQAKWRQIKIVTHIPSELRLFGDPTLLKEVTLELLLNAINVTKPDGQVDLEMTEHVDRGPGEAPWITCSVRDQGDGIAAEDQQELFTEKGTVSVKSSLGGRRKRGTSLGLPLASRIVAAHGGMLEVTSEVGKGSAFHMRLPNPKPRVLLVDDQQLDLDFLATMLDSLNIDVIKARSGPLALVALGEGARNIHHGSGIDLVVTDIAMPVMNGFELLEQIVRDPLTASIPVILLTGEESMVQRVKGFRMGAADFIMKPVQPTDFLASVRRLMCLTPGY
ncbi:MAG: hybrid sensor histidine kinase/response regulator [Magnetococcales bacterium]|nr:hybrid sensor histidine kinase/response regulator [Magnetococcales bacterium]MBF0322285.1 hybrid sensor histidine kinase/response regulator [Magnetococcales bacterium]